MATEVVRRIDAIFAIERGVNGAAAEDRLAIRRERIVPLVTDLEGWMLGSWTTAESASRTTPTNGRSVESPSSGRHGCSPALTGVVSAPPPCSR